MLFIAFDARKKNYPISKKGTSKEIIETFCKAFFPLLTPAILIGGILFGIFTATEAAGVAGVYSTILYLVYSKCDIGRLFKIIRRTARTSASVLFILASAQLYVTLVIRQKIPGLRFLET